MIQYSIPEQSHFSYNIHDEKAMYPLWGLQRGDQFIFSIVKTIEVILPGNRNRFRVPIINKHVF